MAKIDVVDNGGGVADAEIAEVLGRQAGVIARRQVLEAGRHDPYIRRMLRRNEWARIHDGVYVNHTGPPTWQQRAWAAVLYAAPAALCLESAMWREGPLIHVAVDVNRTVLVEPDGVRIHHLAQLDQRALWHVGPPRVRYEEAALDVACRTTEFERSLFSRMPASRDAPPRSASSRHWTAERGYLVDGGCVPSWSTSPTGHVRSSNTVT